MADPIPPNQKRDENREFRIKQMLERIEELAKLGIPTSRRTMAETVGLDYDDIINDRPYFMPHPPHATLLDVDVNHLIATNGRAYHLPIKPWISFSFPMEGDGEKRISVINAYGHETQIQAMTHADEHTQFPLDWRMPVRRWFYQGTPDVDYMYRKYAHYWIVMKRGEM
jgi:hypothetical protein